MGEWFCSNHPSSGVGKVKREQWVVVHVNVWFRNTGGGRGGGVGESERGVVMLCWGGTADGEDEGGAVVLSSLCWGGSADGEDEGDAVVFSSLCWGGSADGEDEGGAVVVLFSLGLGRSSGADVEDEGGAVLSSCFFGLGGSSGADI